MSRGRIVTITRRPVLAAAMRVPPARAPLHAVERRPSLWPPVLLAAVTLFAMAAQEFTAKGWPLGVLMAVPGVALALGLSARREPDPKRSSPGPWRRPGRIRSRRGRARARAETIDARAARRRPRPTPVPHGR